MKKFLTYLFITILSIEISLQITAYALQIYKEKSQRSANAGKGMYRIICIGESTTAMGGDNSYPRLLEKKLNSIAGEATFEVVNAGISGVTTKVIAQKIPEWMETYRPDVAVVMTGINDYWSLPDNGSEKWEVGLEWLARYSRIAKMVRLTYINSKFEDTTFAKSFGTCGMPDASVVAAPSNFNDYISQASTIEKSKGVESAIKFLEEKIHYLNTNGFCDDAYSLEEQVVLYQRDYLKNPKLALKTIEYFLKQNIIPKKRARFIDLKNDIRFQLKMPYDNHQYATAMNYWENSNYKINIQSIVGQLQEEGIPVVVMQYPRLPVEPLKNTIINHAGLTFVENKIPFDNLLKQKKFEDLFEDSFGKVFGHTTPLGAQTLADNLAGAILKIVPVEKSK